MNPISPKIGILGTSYFIQLGLINKKIAVRLYKGKYLIDSHLFKEIKSTLSNELLRWLKKTLPIPNIDNNFEDMQAAIARVKSTLKQENLKILTIDRNYLYEIVNPSLVTILVSDGLPILKPFVLQFFGLNELFVTINGHLITFYEGKELPNEIATDCFDSLFNDFKEIRFDPNMNLSEIIDDDKSYYFKDPEHHQIWILHGKNQSTKNKFIIAKLLNEYRELYSINYVDIDNPSPNFKEIMERMNKKEETSSFKPQYFNLHEINSIFEYLDSIKENKNLDQSSLKRPRIIEFKKDIPDTDVKLKEFNDFIQKSKEMREKRTKRFQEKSHEKKKRRLK